MIKLFGSGAGRSLMKNLRKFEQMKYQNVDDILRDTSAILRSNKNVGLSYKLSSPLLFELADPMARFSCNYDIRESVAISAAESLYLLSGMNSKDFIEYFASPYKSATEYPDELALGPQLRFLGQSRIKLIDSQVTFNFRQMAKGYTDQLQQVIDIFKKDTSAMDVTIQFSSIKNPLPVYSAWFHYEDSKLEMLVSTGYVDNASELYCKIIAPFAFIHQIISELVGIPIGSSRFMIGCLYSSNLSYFNEGIGKVFPTIKMNDFRYPNGRLTLCDIDALFSIMMQFVDRLSEDTFERANPFEGDSRVQMWQDYAEIFRSWKAEKLGYKIQ